MVDTLRIVGDSLASSVDSSLIETLTQTDSFVDIKNINLFPAFSEIAVKIIFVAVRNGLCVSNNYYSFHCVYILNYTLFDA